MLAGFTVRVLQTNPDCRYTASTSTPPMNSVNNCSGLSFLLYKQRSVLFLAHSNKALPKSAVECRFFCILIIRDGQKMQ